MRDFANISTGCIHEITEPVNSADRYAPGDLFVMSEWKKMKDKEILDIVEAAKVAFGPKCGKYSGAVTVEIIKKALEQQGISVSPRDVFIQGVPIEIDLIIPRHGTIPQNGLLYKPSEVLVAIEVKNAGCFGENMIRSIERNVKAIKELNPQIMFCYITLEEREGYHAAVTDKTCNAYTIFWVKGSGRREIQKPSGDWERFVNDMGIIQQKA